MRAMNNLVLGIVLVAWPAMADPLGDNQVQMAGIAARGTRVVGIVTEPTVLSAAADKNAVVPVGVAARPELTLSTAASRPIEALDMESHTGSGVVALEVNADTNRDTAEKQAEGWVDPDIPADTLRPDGDGVINASRPQEAPAGVAASNVKNPWDVRVTPKNNINEYKLKVDGLLLGGDVPVVTINGKNCEKNAKVGVFNLAIIRSSDVILEANGLHFLLPVGQEITIKLPLKAAKQ